MKKKMSNYKRKRIASHALSIASGVGVLSTAYFTYRGTKKANNILVELDNAPKGWKEELKHTYKCYIPAAISGVLTLVCIGVNQADNTKMITGLAAAGAVPAALLKEYEAKARELIGNDEVERIKEAVAQDHLNGIPKADPPVISMVSTFDRYDDVIEGGDVIFYDELFCTEFRSSLNAVRAGIFHLNRNNQLGGYANLDDLYGFWGVEETPVKDPEKYLWDPDWMISEYETTWIDIILTKSIREIPMKNGDKFQEEYYRISYPIAPVYSDFIHDERKAFFLEEETMNHIAQDVWGWEEPYYK